MKSISSKCIARALAAYALTTLAPAAFAAATWTQDLQVDCTVNAQSQACSGSPAATISAWTTGTGTITGPTSGSTFSNAAIVYNWGAAGLGIVSGNEDQRATGPHAIDNGYGIEAMMVNFTSGPVNLSSLTIGWNGTDNPCTSANNDTGTCSSTKTKRITYNDSDLSVLAWTGAASGPTMAGAGLLSAGWTLIGNYADVGASNNSPAKTPGGSASVASTVYSSYWLISAYSTAYGAGTSLNQGNDSFKLLSIAGNYCGGAVSNNSCGGQAPEPGSIALLGLGLVGLVAARHRSQKSV